MGGEIEAAGGMRGGEMRGTGGERDESGSIASSSMLSQQLQ